MKLTKSVKHHVSMGNYEWVEFGAEVTLDTDEPGFGFTPEELHAFVDEQLDIALSEELKQAHALTDEDKSYVHIHPANATPRKAKR